MKQRYDSRRRCDIKSSLIEKQKTKCLRLVVCVAFGASTGATHAQNTWWKAPSGHANTSNALEKAARTSDHKLLDLRSHARVRHGALSGLRVGLHVLEQVVDVRVSEDCLHTIGMRR
jgi:hypothetical protein